MILDRYLVRQFIPIFIIASFLFVMIIILLDLFTNLWRYLNNQVSIREILTVSFYYIPKSFSYALPVSLLFASAYTLGDLYGRNELTAIFSSGVPFLRFALPLMVIGITASVFAFNFDDRVVIPTLKTKNDMSQRLLHQSTSENNSDVVIKANGGDLIYLVDYYDYKQFVLNGLAIVEQNKDGSFASLARAPKAIWNGEYWELIDAVVYKWEGNFLRASALENSAVYREDPETFRRNAVKPEELPSKEVGFLVNDLKNAGLPFTSAQADYYHRYSFSAVSFIVMILSISMGGRFRKNILLMTLLSSLTAAVVFYVMDMVTMMMARLDYIPTFVGAWLPVLTFLIVGALLLQSAKT